MYRERDRKITIAESVEFSATSSSIDTIAHTIEGVVGPSKEAWETAKHEDDHRKAFRGLGRYAVFIVAEISVDRIAARWTASFTSDTRGIDTESPEFFQRMIDTANIVGNDQSGQDKKVGAHFSEKLNAWESDDRLRKQREEDEEKMRRSEKAIAKGDILSPGKDAQKPLIKEDEDEELDEKGEREIVGVHGSIYVAPRSYSSSPLAD